jgi:hypothetical protein
MGYEIFLNKPATKKVASYDLVGGTFQCMYCHALTDEARYYPAQKILSWDCESCKEVNNLEGFSLD